MDVWHFSTFVLFLVSRHSFASLTRVRHKAQLIDVWHFSTFVLFLVSRYSFASLTTELGQRHRVKIKAGVAAIFAQGMNDSKVDNFSSKLSQGIIDYHYRRLQPFVRPCNHFRLERTALCSSRLSIIVEIAWKLLLKTNISSDSWHIFMPLWNARAPTHFRKM